MKILLSGICFFIISFPGRSQTNLSPRQKATALLLPVERKLASSEFLSYDCTLISRSAEKERKTTSRINFHRSDSNSRMKGEFLISGSDAGGEFLYYYPGGAHSFEARPANKRILRFTPGSFAAGPNNPALARTSLMALPDIFTQINLTEKLLGKNPSIKISSDGETVSFAYPKDSLGMIVTRSLKISKADSCITSYSIKINWLGVNSSREFSFQQYKFDQFDIHNLQELSQLQNYPIQDFPAINANESTVTRTLIGETIAPFTYINASNRQVNIEEFRGNYVLLDFWETWCGYCIKDIPKLKELSETYKGKKFQLVGLFNENLKEARKVMEFNKVEYSTGHVETPVIKHLNISARPTYVLIDPSGKIISVETGKLDKVIDLLKQSAIH